MAAQIDNALESAALNETERRAVARIVARLEAELGDDLGREVSAFKWELTPKLIEAVEAEGDSPPYW